MPHQLTEPSPDEMQSPRRHTADKHLSLNARQFSNPRLESLVHEGAHLDNTELNNVFLKLKTRIIENEAVAGLLLH